jgi:hypothetical protein
MKCLLAAVPVDVDAALSLADRGERATICRHLALSLEVSRAW